MEGMNVLDDTPYGDIIFSCKIFLDHFNPTASKNFSKRSDLMAKEAGG